MWTDEPVKAPKAALRDQRREFEMSTLACCLSEGGLAALKRQTKLVTAQGMLSTPLGRSCRHFARLRLGDEVVWAELNTGTLYRDADGSCLSSTDLTLDVHTVEAKAAA